MTIGGCIAAMILGALINDDNIAVPAGILGLGLSFAICRVFWTGVLLEAIVLGCLLFGYIVGESGFGHIHIGASIYFGEVGLIACFVIFGTRVAFTKERFVHRDAISWAVLAFMTIGTLRYLADVASFSGNTKDLLTLTRDFATIYYTAFYFIAFNVLKHERSRRFLEKVFPVAIICLLPVAVVALVDPEIWLRLSYQDQAPIYTRWDLAGSFLGFGAFYFMLSREAHSWRILRTLLAFFCFAFMLAGNSRATVVGFGLGLLFLIHARQFRVIRGFAIFSALGLLALVIISVARPDTGDDNLKSLFKDKIMSIVDLGAIGNYETDYGAGKASNNHFRTEWWKSVYHETMEGNPVVGLGFGYDLAARFLRNYDYAIDPEEFSARSPHSVIFTVFGRMGFLGLASFSWVVFLMFRGGFRCAVAVRKKHAPVIDLAFWCGLITIYGTSCFSVMLEGPMAAIVFWSLFGIASYRQIQTAEASQKSGGLIPLPRNPSSLGPPLAAAAYR